LLPPWEGAYEAGSILLRNDDTGESCSQDCENGCCYGLIIEQVRTLECDVVEIRGDLCGPGVDAINRCGFPEAPRDWTVHQQSEVVSLSELGATVADQDDVTPTFVKSGEEIDVSLDQDDGSWVLEVTVRQL
jgi:hypothetical protein